MKKKLSSIVYRTFSNRIRDNVYIVSACRTPIGSFLGCLSSFTGPELGAIALRSSIEMANLSFHEIDEILMGNVIGAGVRQAPAKQVSKFAGLPDDIPCTAINKVCASGMKSIMFGYQSILAGFNNVVAAGGFESMSNIPYLVRKCREGMKFGHGMFLDALMTDGLEDAFDEKKLMGAFADATAEKYGITREMNDEFAIESYKRSENATENGLYKEIVPVNVSTRKGDILIKEDEEFRNIIYDKVGSLRPAFGKDGVTTAANASKLSDGGASVVLMSEEKLKSSGVKPIGRIIGIGDGETVPEEFTIAPSIAIPKALEDAGISIDDVKHFEINEAFSVVTLACMQILEIDHSIVNVHGGAVALGHPLGCSGARIVTTLLNTLEKGEIGCAGICNGGGGASAMVVERL